MRTIKVLLDPKAPARPPFKVYVDGVEWNDVFGISWETKWGGVNSVTLKLDARFEVEYMDERNINAS